MTVDAEILAKLKNMLDIGKLWRTCQTLCQHRLQNISISAPSVVPHSGASCASCADTKGPFVPYNSKGPTKKKNLHSACTGFAMNVPLILQSTLHLRKQLSWVKPPVLVPKIHEQEISKSKTLSKKTRFALLCMWCFFAFITEKGWLVFHPLKHLGMMSSNHPCHVAPPKKELKWATG